MKNPYLDFFYGIHKKHCQMPCASMEITNPPFQYNPGLVNEAYVRLYFKSIIKVQTSYWSYPIISLLAEVGGYMGLLLGMSLLDLNKVINWLYNLYLQKFN